jgi:hypothetical protein
LKKVTENWLTAKRLTVLLFDEISIKNGLEYNTRKSNDCIEGYEASLTLYFVSSNFRMNLQELGELGRTKSYGTHVLTLIIRGLAQPWKIPISFCISANATKGANQATWLKKIIPKLFEVGLILKLVVCDQGTNNQATFKHMGITYTEPFYHNNNEKVYFKYDDPHIVKCITKSGKETQ